MEKVGVFLSRMQPIHNAHLWMIENALKENDEVLVMIGSANKFGTERNPLPIDMRKPMVESAITKYLKNKNYLESIKIITLSDWSSEENNNDKEWGRLIYYNVVGNMGVKEFSYYSSENPEMIKGWFEEELRERINFRFFSRENEFNGLSATKVREAILRDDDEFIKNNCPMEVFERKDFIKQEIKVIYRELKNNLWQLFFNQM